MFNQVQAKILSIPSRIENAYILSNQLNSLGIEASIFKAVSIHESISCPTLWNHDYIDSTELPPKLPGSTTYETWHKRPNAYNAWKCHRNMMRDFNRDHHTDSTKASHLLLVEDDSFIYEEEFKKQIYNFFHGFTRAREPDMVYFGWYSNGHLDLDDSITYGDTTLYRFKGGAGFHGVLLSYDTVIRLLNMPPVGPFDAIAGRLQETGHINAYAVYPASIIQLDGHSFVEGHHLSKPKRDKI